jgi:hypothetical protein
MLLLTSPRGLSADRVGARMPPTAPVKDLAPQTVWELGRAPFCKRSRAADRVGARLRPFCCKRSRAVDCVGATWRPLM